MTVTTPFSRRAPSEMINSRLLQRSNRAIGTLGKKNKKKAWSDPDNGVQKFLLCVQTSGSTDLATASLAFETTSRGCSRSSIFVTAVTPGPTWTNRYERPARVVSADSLHESTLQTERDKYYTWNPRLLRGVQRSMDPQGLVHVYCRPRNLTRVEDEVLHPVKCVNGIYVASKIHYRLNRPPIPTRDRDGLRILDNLEVLRAKLDAAAPDKKRSLSHEEGETLLFERNWPLTEPNKGKNFQEFIKR